MELLLRETTAYKIIVGDRAQGRLSHAYMLHFPDSANLRAACLIFAAEMYGGDSGVRRRILSGNFPDVAVFPDIERKLTVDDASQIVGGCAVRPSEGDQKIYVITAFDTASAAVQNKLLKCLEEPPEGVKFLLGAAALAPVLSTVRSRVKTLEVPPFSEREIYNCLLREGVDAGNAKTAAAACGGVLGAAQSMARGARFDEINAAAREICLAKDANIGAVCAKYGDFKYKNELLGRMQSLIFSALTGGKEGAEIAARRQRPALLSACERINGAAADVKFNAQFSALLYDFCLRFNEEDAKWKRLSE